MIFLTRFTFCAATAKRNDRAAAAGFAALFGTTAKDFDVNLTCALYCAADSAYVIARSTVVVNFFDKYSCIVWWVD